MTTACLLAALFAQVGPAAAADASPAPVEPIAALDVPRYMGTWHEIARYPNWFQKKCAGDSRADYSLLESGEVRVVNRCREADGGDGADAALGGHGASQVRA